MSTDPTAIVSVLIELRSAALTCQVNPKPLMEKYDLLFGGENFNKIYSIDLRHALETVFKISITLKELNQLVPSICSSLNMPCEPMKALNDMNNPIPAAYLITLF